MFKRKVETENTPNKKLKLQVFQKYEDFTPTAYLESISINDTFMWVHNIYIVFLVIRSIVVYIRNLPSITTMDNQFKPGTIDLVKINCNNNKGVTLTVYAYDLFAHLLQEQIKLHQIKLKTYNSIIEIKNII